MVERRVKVVLASSLILLLVAAFGFGFVLGNPGASTSYVEAGVYPGASTYTVWRESSTYFAKDSYGLIPSWGESSNASYVVQSIMNVMYLTIDYVGAVDYAFMGSVLFKAGTYEFDTQIMLVHEVGDGLALGLEIAGEGRYTTSLKAVGAHPVFNFTSTSRDDRFEAITIHGLEITSDATSRTAGAHGLIFVNATNLNIFDCYFETTYDDGIYIEGLEYNYISDTTFNLCWGYGVEIYLADEPHLQGLLAWNCKRGGFLLSGPSRVDMRGCQASYCNGTGIYLYGVMKSQIVGNQAYMNERDGFGLAGCGNLTLADNVSYSNGQLGFGYGNGIHITDTNQTTISGNRCFDDGATKYQHNGILEDGKSDYNIISGCLCNSNAEENIGMIALVAASSHSRVVNCYNGTVWVSSWGSG